MKLQCSKAMFWHHLLFTCQILPELTCFDWLEFYLFYSYIGIWVHKYFAENPLGEKVCMWKLKISRY